MGCGNSSTQTPDREYFDGQISEVIFYSRVLTNNERMMVENYLNPFMHMCTKMCTLGYPPPLAKFSKKWRHFATFGAYVHLKVHQKKKIL